MIAVRKLSVEYKNNPLGLDVRCPRISWQLIADERDVMQQAYQIQVSAEQAFGSLLWDSGRVESGQSLHVELKELELQPRQRYYYRIKVWDQQNRLTAWSETAWWETGLLSTEEWEAEWIAAPLDYLDVQAEAGLLLRRTFRVERQLSRARMYVTSLGLYEMELNGARVGADYLTPG